jgi:hypothetical protein
LLEENSYFGLSQIIPVGITNIQPSEIKSADSATDGVNGIGQLIINKMADIYKSFNKGLWQYF